MAVLPERRGTGEDWLRTRGYRQASLDTTEPLEAAIAFYEKHGSRRSGSVSDFFAMPLIEHVKHL